MGPRVVLSSLSLMKITYVFGWDCLTWVALGKIKRFMVFQQEVLNILRKYIFAIQL